MEEADQVSRYWCHMCSQTVNPIMEIETIKCPICHSGFVEEMASAATPETDSPLDFGLGRLDSGRSVSLWAPILLGMMGNPSRHHRLRRIAFEDDDNDNDNDNGNGNENNHRHNDGETELDREVRTGRRRSSATILQLIQSMRSGMLSELGNPGTANWDRGRDIDRDTERVILINPFNQTIIVHGSHNNATTSSLGDYFIGPDLDLLLQHLAENDPNRYQLPSEESKLDSEGSRNNSHNSNQESIHNAGNGGDERNENSRWFRVPLLWPFSSLFSSSSSQPSSGNSSATSPSGSSINAPSTSSHADEN
ncbi:UNVERIFIED_CONTAM: hypothetical protein Scaly_0337100 [Sesamum calycinum]|uniref:RING-type E3 ubiquitin transferase n=1 Tax=Sesamum calycinum TaxID=2727403 RepID=A0AAW2SBB7_9LAMI